MPNFIGFMATIGAIGSTAAYYYFQYYSLVNTGSASEFKAGMQVSNGIFWTSIWTYMFLGGDIKINPNPRSN